MQGRDVQTCIRCRESKRRCDKRKPACSRCVNAGIACSFENVLSNASSSNGSNESTSPTDSGYGRTSLSDLSESPAASVTSEPNPRKVDIPMRTIKKRDRACLSCTRCHRLKVKCDKNKPCGRCTRSGHSSSCTYSSNKPAARDHPLFVLTGEDAQDVVTMWFLRRRGSSHWHYLLSRASHLSGLTSMFSEALKEHEDNRCAKEISMPGNFPFGTPESLKYSTASSVHTLIESHRSESQHYIDRYMDLYQSIFPIINTETFHREVLGYWSNPKDTNISWVAQFLIVLGLGAFGITRDAKAAAEFFYAGEACLNKTPYMFRPTVLNISTLCLMVVAKQVATATCWTLDSCWNVMGTVVRLAVMLSLYDGAMPVFPANENINEEAYNRRLWNVVVYLDIQLSVMSGQRLLLPADVLLANTDNMLSDCMSSLDECWDSVMPKSFGVICHFLAKMNASEDQPSYEEVLQYDLEIRRCMSNLAAVPGNSILRLTLDIFHRRVLLCLHRRHALHPDAPALYPTSYWSSLECSLALLVHYRELSEQEYLPLNNEHLISRPFLLDFFAAALTACIHLAPTDAPLAASLTPEGMMPPRQTIIDTLQTCLSLLSKEREQSLCFRAGFRILSSAFESAVAGCNPLHDTWML